MSNVTVNVSFQDTLLQEIDAEAARESRSPPELLREAARVYVRRQKQWDAVFELGDHVSRSLELSPRDVNTAIREVRSLERRDS